MGDKTPLRFFFILTTNEQLRKFVCKSVNPYAAGC